MNKKVRYLLIGLGFVVFLVLAPLIVLYVRGITYDFASKSFVKTGILGVRTQPANAEIYLDGKLKRKSQGDIKFLAPGDYQVEIKAPGYYSWSKRLEVDAGVVTWANPAFDSVYLFLNNPQPKTLAGGVTDFFAQNKNIFYLTKDSFVAASADNIAAGKAYSLPKNVNFIAANDSAGQNFALTDRDSASSTSPALLIFNSSPGQLADLSGMFLAIPKMQFDGNGQLYALSNNTLYQIDVPNKNKNPIFNNVIGFDFQGGDLYFVQKQGENYGLFVSQPPFSGSQMLVSGLPELASADLFVTSEKEILLLGGGNLYLAGSGMQKLANNVGGYGFDQVDSFLSVLRSGEFDYYDPAAKNLNFVTRSSEQLANPVVKTAIGSAFYLQGNKLMAIELDARDHQNQYQLYQGGGIKKFFVDDAGKNILLLDGGELKSLVIR